MTALLGNCAGRSRHSRHIRRRATLLVLCLFAPLPCRSARLTLPDQVATAGQAAIGSLDFTSDGQPVSGVQLDIEADPALSVRVLPGAQLGASGKSLFTAPLPAGGVRVLVVGINQAAIADGELLRFLVSVSPDAAFGPVAIRILNTVGSSPQGEPIAVRTTAATLTVQDSPGGDLLIPTTAVLNGASLLSGAISPGEIVTVVGGSGLAATSAVLFNNLEALLLFAGPGQVNAIVPTRIEPDRNVDLHIRSKQGSLASITLTSAAFSPAIFTQDSTGVGPGLILNEDYSLNSFSSPARSGSIVVLYGTGFGPLTPSAVDGQPAESAAPTATPVSATIAGVAAEVLYAGAAPGLTAGVVQINVRIPHSLAPNATAPVSLSIGTAATPPGVTVSIQ